MRTIGADSAPLSPRGDFVASLAAGLRVLAAFTSERPELGVGELARMLEMDKRRTQRLVSTLFDLGYLDQDPVSRRYRPGVAVLTLGYAALHSLDLRQLARPHLSALLEQFGQTVNLGVRHRRDVVFVECLRGERFRLGVNVHVGDRLPIHLSSLGKALLCRLPDKECAEVIDAIRFEALTPNSVRSSDALRDQLARARGRGYAVMDQETTLGVRSVAAPVLTRDGYPVAAVNVAMPTPLISMAEMEETVAPSVVLAAGRMSGLLAADGDCRPEMSLPGAGS
ncbi:MAG: IclR family transcriptional regulator [Pseudonocardia sp.]|nr:IclR family transcriptional regulator [Pseudonocardia sp.]